jgi:hypothetical protein
LPSGKFFRLTLRLTDSQAQIALFFPIPSLTRLLHQEDGANK